MDTEVSIINNLINKTDPATPVVITGIGERLKTARESMHLSQKEAATRLYLNVKIIEILEKEAFSEGPPPTFMRGYLNSYARLLSVPENEINAALKQLVTHLPAQRELPPPVLKVRSFYPTERYLRWTTAGIAFVLILLVSMWWRSHSKYEIADVPAKPATSATHLTAPKIAPVNNSSVQTQSLPRLIPVPPPLLARPDANPIVVSTYTDDADLDMTPAQAAAPVTATEPQTPHNKKYRKTKSSKKRRNIVMSLPEPN